MANRFNQLISQEYVPLPFQEIMYAAQQRSKQGERPVADVVVRLGADMAHPKGQSGLGSLQRLALALLVTAQNQGLLRGIEVESDDVPELCLEAWIA